MLKKAALVALLLSLAAFEVYGLAALLPFRREETYTPSPLNGGLELLAVFMSSLLVAIGVVSFVSPEAVQGYAVRQSSEWFPTNPFLEWMKTGNYLRFIGFIGIVVYIAGLFAVFLLIKRIGETAFI